MLGVGDDPRESLRKATEVGVDNVQLGCPPDQYLSGSGSETLKRAIQESGLTVTTVFVGFPEESYADIPTVRRTVGYVPRETRAARVAKTRQIADFARALGVDRVASHIGFVPEDPSDPLYGEIVETVRQIADYCKGNGQLFCLETGQETAPTLLRFIADVGRENVKVNFDPANMIMYGAGEPIEALQLLKDHVASVHVKDGKWPTGQDQLGREYPLGQGDVGMERFVQTLKAIGYTGPLTIEREVSGEQQKRDIIAGKRLIERLVQQ
ncbi:MAG: sugar phosphate isomerase/epimerase [Candidatus Latescibacteria bacterium]|nr:sugar phosphate isomerase/epimerase [Candidatus Latescibacterota bacterium]